MAIDCLQNDTIAREVRFLSLSMIGMVQSFCLFIFFLLGGKSFVVEILLVTYN